MTSWRKDYIGNGWRVRDLFSGPSQIDGTRIFNARSYVIRFAHEGGAVFDAYANRSCRDHTLQELVDLLAAARRVVRVSTDGVPVEATSR